MFLDAPSDRVPDDGAERDDRFHGGADADDGQERHPLLRGSDHLVQRLRQWADSFVADGGLEGFPFIFATAPPTTLSRWRRTTGHFISDRIFSRDIAAVVRQYAVLVDHITEDIDLGNEEAYFFPNGTGGAKLFVVVFPPDRVPDEGAERDDRFHGRAYADDGEEEEDACRRQGRFVGGARHAAQWDRYG